MNETRWPACGIAYAQGDAVRRLLPLAVLVPTLVLAADIPLSRDPQTYLVLGMQRTTVNSLSLEPPGCNVGVNCAPLVGERGGCGFFHLRNGHFPEPSQVAANQVCGTGSFFQIFSNLPTCADPTCAAIEHAGSSPDCTEPFIPPILGDLDGDGVPSCDTNCATDLDDIALACGVTLPFPDCDPSTPIVAPRNADCSIGDVVPGNAACDLDAGVYGSVRVLRGARINFAAGTTVICSLQARSAARVRSVGPATILIPGGGSVQFNNSEDVGSECGMLRIVAERGTMWLGRYGDYTLDACTIGGRLRLGHGNNLRGHFVGNAIASDVGNNGECCPSTTTTTTTSTTSSTGSSTTTTSTSSPTSSTSPETIPPSTTTSAPKASTTTAPTGSSTTTSAPGASTTTAPTGSSTTTSGPRASTTTTSSSTTTLASTTTTTLAALFTRTPGFYKNHPDITQQILSSVGGFSICGHAITDVGVNDGHSALEALCINIRGDQRLQLVRQLLTAALNMAAGGAIFPNFAACNAVCQDPLASTTQLSACIDRTDTYNQSGDGVAAPFDPPGPAAPGLCGAAFETPCTVLTPALCAQP